MYTTEDQYMNINRASIFLLYLEATCNPVILEEMFDC